jgi:hypothetical protein
VKVVNGPSLPVSERLLRNATWGDNLTKIPRQSSGVIPQFKNAMDRRPGSDQHQSKLHSAPTISNWLRQPSSAKDAETYNTTKDGFQ